MKGGANAPNGKRKMKIVIGSWGSYNECNERALGSEWLDLADFNEWEEIEEELKNQGFELDGIDEELFIQDIEGDWGFDCDYMHPKRLFEIMLEGNLHFNGQEDIALAYIEARSWEDLVNLIESKGKRWDEDIYFHKNMTPVEVAEDMINSCYPDLDFSRMGWLSNYVTIDYEAIADDEPYYEVEGGTIEIRE